MAMGHLKRNKTLVGRVRVFKGGLLMAMGPLEQDSGCEGPGVSVGMVGGPGALEKEQDSGCEGQEGV